MNAGERALPVVSCWSRIGTLGDASCPKLAEVVHCNNCSVFGDAARAFFDRPAPEGYREELSELVAQPSETKRANERSVMLFEASGQPFAIDARDVVEVAENRPVHRVPHRTSRVVLGLVNIRGQLELCVSLQGLLQIPSPKAAPDDACASARLVLIEKDGQRWVFRVEAVHGVRRFSSTDLSSLPATASHADHACARGVLAWDERRVGYLATEKLVALLAKSVR